MGGCCPAEEYLSFANTSRVVEEELIRIGPSNFRIPKKRAICFAGNGCFDNKAHGRTYGIEAAINWNVTSWWKVAAGYTWFESHLRRDPSGQDAEIRASEGNDPHHQFNFRSYLNLPWGLEFDMMGYYVDTLQNLHIPSYVRLDLRLGWRLTDTLELSLVGQDLIDARHLEFRTFSPFHPTEVERGMYGKVMWQF